MGKAFLFQTFNKIIIQCSFIVIKSKVMDPSISIENEKLALELKFLIALQSQDKQHATLKVLNRLYPFTVYPLHTVPPLEFHEYQAGQIISKNLKNDLDSYSFIILLGKCQIQKSIYSHDQQKFIDKNIRDHIIFNLDQGITTVKSIQNTSILKIHNIWIQLAMKKYEQTCRKYIESKLLNLPFFSSMDFDHFHKICSLATIKIIGPNEILIDQNIIPYNMYIVAEGELAYRKKVQFMKQNEVWRQVNDELQKKGTLCEQLYEYLVRQPNSKHQTFLIDFQVKLIGEGAIICGKETLQQQFLSYSIRSTLKSKIICIKYPDLYVLSQDKMAEIRMFKSITINKRDLRKQYYYQIKWATYKEHLKKSTQLSLLEGQKFQDFLRKNINLSEKKYSYFPSKIGTDNYIESPQGKVNRIKEMTFKSK